VGTRHAPGNLGVEGALDLHKLLRLHDVEDLLRLVQEHDLLGAVDLGPVAEEAQDHLLTQRLVLLQELHDAVGELGVVQGQGLGLV
jgi:hypothetical protein